MNISFLEDQDTTELENLLIKDGLFVPASYEKLKTFPQETISVFCVKHALYQVPTIELIDFLKDQMGGVHTIEIGSGNGVIGRSLGIQMADNYMQTWPAIKDHYKLMFQPTITYGKDVENLGGNEAVKKYKPEMVVACWLTQKWKDGVTSNGNMFGVDESMMFEDGVKKYIHVGNEKTHANKIMLKQHPHTKLKFPWLISRSMQRSDNAIYIFTP